MSNDALRSNPYIMEDPLEAYRLHQKTDEQAVEFQARWCGMKAGDRVLDAGCGSGKTTSILHGITNAALGIDYSAERLEYAEKNFGGKPGLEFQCADFTKPLDLTDFDFVWVKFVLEYFLDGAMDIVRNLTGSLKPGGCMCLLDLDYNCMTHYEMPEKMQETLEKLLSRMSSGLNFDPFAGRKLYSILYDLGYTDIEVSMVPHHLIYGKLRNTDDFNWTRKVEMASVNVPEVFESYPSGYKGFFDDFRAFSMDPRRFTYTPLIMCKGRKPLD